MTSNELHRRFHAADTFPAFLENASENRDLWTSVWRRTNVSDGQLARAEALPGRWHLLVLCVDWCGDGANTVPVIARLAEAADNLDLRLLDRDENPDLRDAHLTNGAQSIPVVIILDEDFVERGWWGPRPALIQQWVAEKGMSLPPEERYRHVRTWYARERGQTTIEEVLTLLESLSPPRADSPHHGEANGIRLSVGSADANEIHSTGEAVET